MHTHQNNSVAHLHVDESFLFFWNAKNWLGTTSLSIDSPPTTTKNTRLLKYLCGTLLLIILKNFNRYTVPMVTMAESAATHVDRTTFLTWKNCHNFFVCSWRDSNLCPLDLESDALPIQPPRQHVKNWLEPHGYLGTVSASIHTRSSKQPCHTLHGWKLPFFSDIVYWELTGNHQDQPKRICWFVR